MVCYVVVVRIAVIDSILQLTAEQEGSATSRPRQVLVHRLEECLRHGLASDNGVSSQPLADVEPVKSIMERATCCETMSPCAANVSDLGFLLWLAACDSGPGPGHRGNLPPH